MEHKIGEIFEDRGYWYQCLESNSCRCGDCEFDESGDCDIIACMSGERKDDKEVHFKKLKKVGDPYLAHDHSRNKDVVVQDYKLYNQHACYNGHEEMLSFGLYGRNEIVTIKSKEPIKSLNCENSVEIQIKQNKEDMEEKKLNLKPFDLEAAKAGKPVCTRDGKKARIICFDRKDIKPIVALVAFINGTSVIEKAFYYFEDGYHLSKNDKNNYDLMMLPEKKEGWVNVYKGGLLDTKSYPTKKEAFDKACPEGYVDTIKISWEE